MPDVKNEPEDLPLTKKRRSRKDEEDRAKRYTMDDIPVNRRTFRQKVVPTYIEFLMSTRNPFDLHDDLVTIGLQNIFNFIFPEDKQLVLREDPIKYLVRAYKVFLRLLLHLCSVGRSAIHGASW